MVTKVHFRNTFRRAVVMLAVSFLAGISSTFAAGLEAKLDRDSVPAGNGALLTLTISGRSPGAPEIPEIPEFVIRPNGQSQEVRMFNGTTTISTTYRYVVGSNTPGDYEIPAITMTLDGEEHVTQPLKLKVLANDAAQPPAGLPGNAGNTAGTQGQPVEPEEDESKRFGFLTVELADTTRKHVYVGEIAPVRIRAWLPRDSNAHLRSGIQPDGKGFTLHNVSNEPQQTEEMRDGKRYVVATWYGGISATRPGNLPASLFVDATVAVRDKNVRRRQTGDTMLDQLLNRNGPMTQKDVKLKSEDQQIEVRSLPEEGRPANFHGPVGKFNFGSVKIPTDWKTGEPQQIEATLEGSGNFALMDTPELSPSDAWKSYPGKGDFQPGDQASFSGSKSFRFSATARKGGDKNAFLTFSYFDPEAGKYETLSGGNVAVRVTGADITEEKAAPAEGPPPEPAKKTDTLVGQHVKPAGVDSLVPLVSRPLFHELLGTAGGLCIGGIIAAFLRRRATDPTRRARAASEKATREALATANAARDVSGFFAAARLAIQQRLAALWNQPPQAITLAEVQARIPGDSPVTRFFREADMHEYNRQLSGEILPRWRALLDEAMTSLNTR